MEKLTEYVDGKYIRIKGTKSLYPKNERDGAPLSNAIARLAAYEETGLKPEAVEHLKLASMGKAIAEIKEFEGVPIDRLRKLAQAYRLLGNTVYEPNKRGVISTYKIPVKSQNPGFAQKEIPPYNQSTQAGSKP